MPRPLISVPMPLKQAVEEAAAARQLRLNRWGAPGSPVPSDRDVEHLRFVAFTIVVCGVPADVDFDRVRALRATVVTGRRGSPVPDVLDRLFDQIVAQLDGLVAEREAAVR